MGSHELLRMILLVVFLGWLMVWILFPSKIYYKDTWTPKLYSKLNSTYFREQGTNLLLFTFPIMFIGALGSVYLHLSQKNAQKSPPLSGVVNGAAHGRLSFLKRPLLVMSPIGIVTAMELTFSAMFVALLIWSLSNYLHISFGHLHMHRAGEKVWEAKLRSVSLRLGYIGNICWAFLFFPVTRGSSILPLVGLTSESSIKYHIWLGHLSMVLFAGHTIGFIIYWAITNQMKEMLEWSRTWEPNVAGEIAILIALAMWVTSFPRIRRKMFEVFFYTHHLYILYILFYSIHVGVEYVCMVVPGIFLFLIDRHLRFLQSQRHIRLLSARLLPCNNALELNFSKSPSLYYNPTSIVFINVPKVSKLQWHPFTVTSSCNMEPDKLSVAIKTVGSWSQKLYQELSSSALDHLNVHVEGPYGPSASHFLRHEKLVMVSGGSGITPFISIIRELIFQSQQPKSHVPSVLLICAFKNSNDLTMLDLMLPDSTVQFSQFQLQIEAYITREKEEPPPIRDYSLKHIQSIWFKLNPMDSPISAVLGSNNWLWLAAIISLSFLTFLLLLGIVTRCYIYPIENNSGEEYNWTYKVMWYLFLLFVGISICGSAVFLWCKRENVREISKPNLNIEVIPTPKESSRSSWIYGSEGTQEMESLRHESLVQATKVHFGARPNLKKILLECKGEDVGVLVCGPRNMRHEVARICSSPLSNNLHFESISFNW